jgi:methenyltetrahydromethanopterin cyclohydrolase
MSDHIPDIGKMVPSADAREFAETLYDVIIHPDYLVEKVDAVDLSVALIAARDARRDAELVERIIVYLDRHHCTLKAGNEWVNLNNALREAARSKA